MEKDRVLFPGDIIGTTEEYISGEGTYEDDGKVFSMLTGRLKLDSVEMIASVEPLPSVPATLRVGDYVIGSVTDIRNSLAEIDIEMVQGNRRTISGGTSGTIHISKISSRFIQDIHQAYSIGDIIRARVLQVEPSVQLTTAEPMLGSIRSDCLTCRVGLNTHNDKLLCPQCERVFEKKISRDYGEFRIDDPPPSGEPIPEPKIHDRIDHKGRVDVDKDQRPRERERRNSRRGSPRGQPRGGGPSRYGQKGRGSR